MTTYRASGHHQGDTCVTRLTASGFTERRSLITTRTFQFLIDTKLLEFPLSPSPSIKMSVLMDTKSPSRSASAFYNLLDSPSVLPYEIAWLTREDSDVYTA